MQSLSMNTVTEVHNLDYSGIKIAIEGLDDHPLIARFIKRIGKTEAPASSIDVALAPGEEGIRCAWWCGSKKPLLFETRLESLLVKQRSFPASRKGVFNQAVGKKTSNVLDATGGWGADALLMCLQGYDVTVIERHPLMALMLEDAFNRLGKTPWAQENEVSVPRLVFKDAEEYFSEVQTSGVDCIYLDPMFPPKRKKSAAVNKQMQFLQWLLPSEQDAAELLSAALATNVKRVVVKRPQHAAPLLCDPQERFSGKLVHYDVYFKT